MTSRELSSDDDAEARAAFALFGDGETGRVVRWVGCVREWYGYDAEKVLVERRPGRTVRIPRNVATATRSAFLRRPDAGTSEQRPAARAAEVAASTIWVEGRGSPDRGDDWRRSPQWGVAARRPDEWWWIESLAETSIDPARMPAKRVRRSQDCQRCNWPERDEDDEWLGFDPRTPTHKTKKRTRWMCMRCGNVANEDHACGSQLFVTGYSRGEPFHPNSTRATNKLKRRYRDENVLRKLKQPPQLWPGAKKPHFPVVHGIEAFDDWDGLHNPPSIHQPCVECDSGDPLEVGLPKRAGRRRVQLLDFPWQKGPRLGNCKRNAAGASEVGVSVQPGSPDYVDEDEWPNELAADRADDARDDNPDLIGGLAALDARHDRDDVSMPRERLGELVAPPMPKLPTESSARYDRELRATRDPTPLAPEPDPRLTEWQPPKLFRVHCDTQDPTRKKYCERETLVSAEERPDADGGRWSSRGHWICNACLNAGEEKMSDYDRAYDRAVRDELMRTAILYGEPLADAAARAGIDTTTARKIPIVAEALGVRGATRDLLVLLLARRGADRGARRSDIIAEIVAFFGNESKGDAVETAEDIQRETEEIGRKAQRVLGGERTPAGTPAADAPLGQPLSADTVKRILDHGRIADRWLRKIEALTWGDVDEHRGRWRVRASVAKTGSARWVTPPDPVFAAVNALLPRDDRAPDRQVFGGFGADRFRTALTRACTAAGVPTFSPHDLRHRRVSLLHAQGLPWARIGEIVGHTDLMTTARTYTHVVADEAEIDYVSSLAGEASSST